MTAPVLTDLEIAFDWLGDVGFDKIIRDVFLFTLLIISSISVDKSSFSGTPINLF